MSAYPNAIEPRDTGIAALRGWQVFSILPQNRLTRLVLVGLLGPLALQAACKLCWLVLTMAEASDGLRCLAL